MSRVYLQYLQGLNCTFSSVIKLFPNETTENKDKVNG